MSLQNASVNYLAYAIRKKGVNWAENGLTKWSRHKWENVISDTKTTHKYTRRKRDMY